MKFLGCVCWCETLPQTDRNGQKQHTHKRHKNMERLVFVLFIGVFFLCFNYNIFVTNIYLWLVSFRYLLAKLKI